MFTRVLMWLCMHPPSRVHFPRILTTFFGLGGHVEEEEEVAVVVVPLYFVTVL